MCFFATMNPVEPEIGNEYEVGTYLYPSPESESPKSNPRALLYDIHDVHHCRIRFRLAYSIRVIIERWDQGRCSPSFSPTSGVGAEASSREMLSRRLLAELY